MACAVPGTGCKNARHHTVACTGIQNINHEQSLIWIALQIIYFVQNSSHDTTHWLTCKEEDHGEDSMHWTS